MKIEFFKYQGTGNDFILLDNRDGKYSGMHREKIAFLCDRHFGIGADGLILLNSHADYDFEMDYYNSDGRRSTMCGNGGRCISRFARDLGMVEDQASFIAIDGEHIARFQDDQIALKMIDVPFFSANQWGWELNTGSPHLVLFREDVHSMDVKKEGRKYRYSDHYSASGINVNFVQIAGPSKIRIRTYERGVEDETLSCGTGVTASSLAFMVQTKYNGTVEIETLGGTLKVSAKQNEKAFFDVYLIGMAERVFSGRIEI